MPEVVPTRREFLTAMGVLTAAFTLPGFSQAQSKALLCKPIPGSNQCLPVIGMGTWQTFNVGSSASLRQARTLVLQKFFELGGRMVDCSPMYGSSADVLGYALQQLDYPEALFAASKIWTSNGDATAEQLNTQQNAWGIQRFDLMQVHNLLSWQAHLDHLMQLKADGSIRYIGITTSHGRRHRELEHIMQSQPLDFVQLTYNIRDRVVEQRLLPLARERDIAIIANRPYGGGGIIKTLQSRHPVPAWARDELDCRTWADYLLKFIVSHNAITCAIPATTQVVHMQENMAAGSGTMPDDAMRQRMAAHVASL